MTVRAEDRPPLSDPTPTPTPTPSASPKGPLSLDDYSGGGQGSSTVVDSRPVSIGWTERTVTYPFERTVRESNSEWTVASGQQYLEDLRGKGGKDYENFVAALRRWSNSKLGTTSAIDKAWHEVLQTAAGSKKNAFDVLMGTGVPGGDGMDGPGSGVYRGPVTTVTTYNDADLRVIADTIGSTVLGRGLSNDEYAAIKSKVRTAEQENPSISGAGIASQTNQAGISQQGREDVIRRALLQQDGAKEFTLATKMMGLFDQALQERPDAGQ